MSNTKGSLSPLRVSTSGPESPPSQGLYGAKCGLIISTTSILQTSTSFWSLHLEWLPKPLQLTLVCGSCAASTSVWVHSHLPGKHYSKLLKQLQLQLKCPTPTKCSSTALSHSA